MAVRLEKAFGADRKPLAEMQAAYDQRVRRVGEKEVAVRAFVPNFLTIKARQIEDWADSQIESRSQLSRVSPEASALDRQRPPPSRLPRL